MSAMLEGKVGLVTGGASGFGRAISLAFARDGAKVVVADVDVKGGEETVGMVKKLGADAIFIRCDVSQASDVVKMLAKTVETFGRLDCAVNNAGIEGALEPILDYPEEVWARILNINLTGVWFCMKQEVAQMLKQGGGTIVNISSAAGLIGVPGSSGYTATKHGVIGLTKTVALEYAKAGIRVNAVCPGAFYTPMLDRILERYPDMQKFYEAAHPIGRMGDPKELADAVVWLCSDRSSFVTGHSLSVDGGLTAQ